MSSKRTRVLFIAEAVTLAHVARPAALAAALPAAEYDVHFAHCPRFSDLLGDVDFTEHPIKSVPTEQFTQALAKGKPLYDLPTLRGYVEEELSLLREVKPDVVVGDFRITLAVSARLLGIPFITITNACWSPYVRQHYVVPDLPLSRALGPALGQLVFQLGRPFVFALHSLPMRKLRKEYGLEGLGLNLQRVYTHADYVFYADLPGLYSMQPLPPGHEFIGPIPWSPRSELPPWWDQLPTGKQIVYVTPGSSGRAELLPDIISALSALDLVMIVATAGQDVSLAKNDKVFSAAFLPGDIAAERADLVVCNGGSPTTHQALACGTPVIGIANNMDQFLNMQTLESVGVGACLRSDSFKPEELRNAVQKMLKPEVVAKAGDLSREIGARPGTATFCNFMNENAASWVATSAG
jgi:UDP:flavonoid glycosyltransferase YjiC (YdhE family)